MNINRYTFQVHIAVLLFGMTGIFGKLLPLHPLIIVLGRVVFSFIFVGIWMGYKNETFKLSNKKDLRDLIIMGIVLAVHWTTFFWSIQLSNVAIGLLTFSTFPIFVTFFSALIFKTKINSKEVVYAILIIIGILIIVPLKDIFSATVLGAVVGTISGAIYAIFTIYNEILSKKMSSRSIAFYEQLSASIFLLPSFFVIQPVFTIRDILLLLLLGTVFTGIAHTLLLNGLKGISAYFASIITMLEPIYSIILAYIILGESINLSVVIGGSIILFTVYQVSLQSKGKTS
ncbi:MAG TPA: DMT family transporter [Clostridia bacterium]|nr:DMT family transporter [Clostridia bacterium]